MAKNLYFSDNVKSEQNLYENIVIESLKIYGQEVYYLPKDLVNENKIFGEDVPSRFNSSHKLEMYIENTDGFDGEGDLMTRFGVEIRDEATFIVARRRWNDTVKRYDNEINAVRPLEGDLIYLPMSKSMFQILHVEHEQPFYQLRNVPVYKMRCQLFEYNDEDLDTGVDEIDAIERDYAYTYTLTLDQDGVVKVGSTAQQTLSSGVIISGEVSAYSDSDNKLHLIHVNASDSKYHSFATTLPITVVMDSDGSNKIREISGTIAQDLKSSPTEQNDIFSTEAEDFLDFSESNPFGDPN